MKTMSNGKSDSKSNDASNYPLKDIEFPHVHDVLCGRGGLSNNHVGNTHWRMLIAANKSIYVSLRKSHKILLSRSIVYAIRGQNPPGRFLQKDGKSGLWYDVGDHKAQEKTSQALREGAPDVVRSLLSPETVGAANDPFLTPQSYNPPSTQANATFVSTRSDPDAMYPPVNAGPYMLNVAHPMRGPCVAYPPMYMPPGMPYFPPHVPTPPYPGQSYPTCSSPQVVPSRAPETLQIPTLNTEASPTENKTAADTTPSSLEEPPKTEKGGATDNDDNDKTESEKPEIVSSDGHEPLSFGRLETLRLESMGISSFATQLEAAGTSFARMSFSLLPDPVDGGLETFGSLSLNETPPRRSSSPPLTKLAHEMPTNSKTRQRQRSPGGLLDDSEDEDESEATNPSNKTADWEKMRAVFDLKQHDKNTAAAAAASLLDKNAPVPTASLNGDISSGVMSTFSTLSSRGTFGENSTPVPPAALSPPRELSEREKLEMEYLNRGVSLACQDFDMNRS